MVGLGVAVSQSTQKGITLITVTPHTPTQTVSQTAARGYFPAVANKSFHARFPGRWTGRECSTLWTRRRPWFDNSWLIILPRNELYLNLMSVWPCIVDDMKRVKPTRCYTMVYWTLWIAQHVSGITMPIIRSPRLHRWSQRMAPHQQPAITKVRSHSRELLMMGIVMPETCWAIHKVH